MRIRTDNKIIDTDGKIITVEEKDNGKDSD